MTVTVEKPKIVMLMYRQERSDEDYGSCLWARFNFDLKHYSMSIEQLCARFNWEYFLGKISSQTVIDGKATFQKVQELMERLDEDVFVSIDEEGMEKIESACTGRREETEAYMAICSILGEYGFSEYDSYDVACCIEKDYPNGAKKIAQIYRDHIQPVVRKLAKEELS